MGETSRLSQRGHQPHQNTQSPPDKAHFVILSELFPFCLCAVPPNWAEVNEAIPELNKGAPVVRTNHNGCIQKDNVK